MPADSLCHGLGGTVTRLWMDLPDHLHRQGLSLAERVEGRQLFFVPCLHHWRELEAFGWSLFMQYCSTRVLGCACLSLSHL